MADRVSVSPITDDMVERSTFWNDRVGRVDPTREGQALRWLFGPLKASSDPKQKWCEDCYGVVAEEGNRRWCRACKASESIADPARQAIVDGLVQAVGAGVREWLRHREHVSCGGCKNGGLPTFEQRVAKAIEAALAGCTVVELPTPDDTATIRSRHGEHEQRAWHGPGDYGPIIPVVWRPPLFDFEPYVETAGHHHEADEAEKLGLQLIAAAREARRLAVEQRAGGSQVGDQR